MNRTGRDYLKNGTSIFLTDNNAIKEYIIEEITGEGGSAVCYEAVRKSDGMPGKLKEFYPYDQAYMLERQNGCLIARNGYENEFIMFRDAYVKSYQMLRDVMKENRKNQILKNYVQDSEILYGNGQGCVTAYVWSPGIMGTKFSDYLDEVWSNPNHPDRIIHDMIRVVLSLTDCMRAFHVAGLLHLDIKPSNFLVPYDSEGNINTANISLFDINTLYSAFDDIPAMVGTEGYRAPETYRGNVDNRSDIYSIGAMLYYAITGELYNGKYREIDEHVRHSKLVEASESGNDSKLMAQLTGIMKKCLAHHPDNRYDGCGQLIDALKKVEIRASLHSVSTKLIGQNKRLAIIDDIKGIADPDVVMQKVLYDHPLFENLGDSKDIHVLVIGTGLYGFKFIDQCLQAGQMTQHLHIHVLTATPDEDREEYLRQRPAISSFVNVDGSFDNPNSYGELCFDSFSSWSFENAEFKTGNSDEQNRQLVSAITENHIRFHYVFVSLGLDKLNRTIASLFSDCLIGSPVCYISEKTVRKTKRNSKRKLYPVCINEVITPKTISPELELSAFNTHISWANSLNMDAQEEMRKFYANQYNFASSVAYALSIKYKLYSFGIETNDMHKAAETFANDVVARIETDENAKTIFDSIVALEHRRWVLYLVTKGWTAPNGGYDEIVISGKVRNEEKKTHPCIVFSTGKTPLSEPEYQNRARWEMMNSELDDLDRVSVELHQCFMKHANAFKTTNPLQSEDLKALGHLVEDYSHEITNRAYGQFVFCLKNILDGVESYTRQFEFYIRQLADSIAEERIRNQAVERMGLVKKAFYPVIEANLYRDYKSYDAIMVQSIPFILAFRFNENLAMGFDDGKETNGNNEALFSNVASATVLCPKKLLYLYYLTDNGDTALFVHSLSNVLNFYQTRHAACKISIAVATSIDEIDIQMLRELMDTVKQAENFEEYWLEPCNGKEDAKEFFISCMASVGTELYDGSTRIFEFDEHFGQHMDGIGYFEFDSQNKVFTRHEGCDYLSYVNENSSLRVPDLFALQSVWGNRQVPDYGDGYQALWRIYKGDHISGDTKSGIRKWNRLCNWLKQYEDNRKPLAVFPFSNDIKPTEHIFLLPVFAYNTVRRVLIQLEEYKVIDRFEIISYSGDMNKVTIQASRDLDSAFDSLFSKPYLLLDYYGVKVINEEQLCKVICNEPGVQDVLLDSDDNAIYGTLQELQRIHYITGLILCSDHVSFTYTSPQLKKLLTNPNEIIRTYIYYEAVKTGLFDDIVVCDSDDWDLILTRGYRTVMIAVADECKLNYIAERFGIGATKVLVNGYQACIQNGSDSAKTVYELDEIRCWFESYLA